MSLEDVIQRVVQRGIGSGDSAMEAQARLFACGIMERFHAWSSDEADRGTNLSEIMGATTHLLAACAASILTLNLTNSREREIASLLCEVLTSEITMIADRMATAMGGPS